MENQSFAEYQLITESAQFLTERRQHASNIYMSMNVAIFSVILFIAKDFKDEGWLTMASVLSICFLGILICLAWRAAIRKYARLIGWKYEQLRVIEQRPEMGWSHKICSREWEEIYVKNWKAGEKSFSNIEMKTPALLISVYALGFLGIAFFFDKL